MKQLNHALVFIFFFACGFVFSVNQANAQLKTTFSGFIDSGFDVTHQTSQGETAWSWRLNEIELGLEQQFSSLLTAKLAINYIRWDKPFDAVTFLDGLIQEAWIRVQKDFQNQLGLYIQLGRFYAPQGWDAVNTVDRYQVTSSYANVYTPNTFTGTQIGLRYRWLHVYAYVTNGWDNVEELDTEPTVGGGLELNIGFLEWKFSVANGLEPSAVSVPFRDQRSTLLDTQLTFRFWKGKIILAAEGFALLHPSERSWYGWLFFAHVMPSKFIGFSLRTSRWSDPQGLLENRTIDEVSVALLSRPLKHLIVMAEYRVDIFQSNIQQHLFAMKAIFHF